MQELQKHKYNIFPTNEEDYQKIKENIEKNGYDNKMPIYLYQGQILDGYHRWKACKELGKKPFILNFEGDDKKALDFSIRANVDRRQLNSSQRAAYAVDAMEFYQEIEKATEEEKKKKLSISMMGNKNAEKNSSSNKLEELNLAKSNSDGLRTVDKVAKAYGTNNAYVSEAKKLKTENPEKYQEVKEGKTTLTKIKTEKRSLNRSSAHREYKTFASNIKKSIEDITKCNDRFTPRELAKFIDNDLQKVLEIVQSWNPPINDCKHCGGTGHVESTGTQLDCDYCDKGKVGKFIWN